MNCAGFVPGKHSFELSERHVDLCIIQLDMWRDHRIMRGARFGFRVDNFGFRLSGFGFRLSGFGEIRALG